jgi:Ca2+-binding EF-hand superfamily protein
MMEKFKKYDVDNDGKISKKELVTWVFGPNGADEKACFTEMVQAEMIR